MKYDKKKISKLLEKLKDKPVSAEDYDYYCTIGNVENLKTQKLTRKNFAAIDLFEAWSLEDRNKNSFKFYFLDVRTKCFENEIFNPSDEIIKFFKKFGEKTEVKSIDDLTNNNVNNHKDYIYKLIRERVYNIEKAEFHFIRKNEGNNDLIGINFYKNPTEYHSLFWKRTK